MRLRRPLAPVAVAEVAQVVHAQAVVLADLVGAAPVAVLQLRGRLPAVSRRLRAVVAVVVAVQLPVRLVAAVGEARRAASRSGQSVKNLSSSQRQP